MPLRHWLESSENRVPACQKSANKVPTKLEYMVMIKKDGMNRITRNRFLNPDAFKVIHDSSGNGSHIKSPSTKVYENILMKKRKVY